MKMAEEVHFQQIVPGQCPPEGCPPPTRIECIVVDKVYDSCFQLDDRSQNTIITEFIDRGCGAMCAYRGRRNIL
jgi:hypothetical protein